MTQLCKTRKTEHERRTTHQHMFTTQTPPRRTRRQYVETSGFRELSARSRSLLYSGRALSLTSTRTHAQKISFASEQVASPCVLKRRNHVKCDTSTLDQDACVCVSQNEACVVFHNNFSLSLPCSSRVRCRGGTATAGGVVHVVIRVVARRRCRRAQSWWWWW